METRISAGIAKLGKVDGDLTAEDHVVIRSSGTERVTVSGTANFEGGAEIDCDFECTSLEAEDGLVRVNGGLTVHEAIDIGDALYTKGDLDAKEIDVGGRLFVGGSLKTGSADVGGSVEVQGNLTAQTVDVGGSFEVGGETRLGDLDVGGKAEIRGGEVSGKVDIGGSFSSAKFLTFKLIDVGGTIYLTGGTGQSIDVGGKLESKGDLTCDDVDVGGIVSIEGSLHSKRTDIGGRISVSGDLGPVENFDVGGVAEIGGVLSGVDVDIGGSLKASKVLLSGTVSVAGLVSTAIGLKAERVKLGKGSKCIGVIVGRRVIIERRAEVQDVYCSSLEADDGSKMGRVFAEDVRLGDDCHVEQLLYTRVLEQGDRVAFTTAPQKAESLPPPPL